MQDFVAPEVRQLKADLGGLGAKVEAMNSKFESKFDAQRTEFDALRSEVRANQQALMAALQKPFCETRWERSAKLASCANELPVLKISFVLFSNNHTSIHNSRASKR